MIGETIDRYRVVEKLGQGGMGVVYKARDTLLGRFVALKVLPAETAGDPGRRQRFVDEAKAASALQHPGIVAVHDVVQADGRDVIVMEHVGGETLEQRSRDGDLYDTRHAVFRPAGISAAQLESGYWRAYRDFYRCGSILRAAAAKPDLAGQLRHAAHAIGWKKCEPVWDLLIRARRVGRALPILERVLSGARGPSASSARPLLDHRVYCRGG